MPPAYRHPTVLASPAPHTLKPSLVYAGLLAGAVGGAPESIPAPVLDDPYTPANNKAGAIASIRNWLTLPKARRLSGAHCHQGPVST